MADSVVEVSKLTTEIVNPLMKSTISVFETMLDCKPERVGLSLREQGAAPYELSAVVGVTGKATGAFVLGVPTETATNILERLVGIRVYKVNAAVRDAVGEVINMIAGSTKAKLASLELSISIPNLVSGEGHEVYYPSEIPTICLAFDSTIGPFFLEAGFEVR